jgi:hypothetical protein
VSSPPAGVLLMIVGGLSVYLRAAPERLWQWLEGQTTMIITVKDDDAAFVWVQEWFLEQKFLKRIRRVDLDTTLRNERIAMIPAPGNIGSGIAVDRLRCGFLPPTTRAKERVDESNHSHSERWGGTALSCNVSWTTCGGQHHRRHSRAFTLPVQYLAILNGG